MRLLRWNVFAVLCLAALPLGCGSKASRRSHGPAATPAPAPPTPDTTPIEALRTPSGLVLRLDVSSTPAAGATVTPTVSVGAAPTPAATAPAPGKSVLDSRFGSAHDEARGGV